MQTATDNQTTELTIIDKSIDVIKTGSEILKNNQGLAAKAVNIGQKILSDLITLKEARNNNSITPDEYTTQRKAIDDRCNNYLANCSNAKKKMFEERSPITQIANLIVTQFTEQENLLDVKKAMTVPSVIQSERNHYAKELFEEQEKVRKDAEAKAAKGKEAIDMRAYLKNSIAQCLIDFLSKRKLSITNSFNDITLENYDAKSEGLKKMLCGFPVDRLKEIVKYNPPLFTKHTEAEMLVIQGEENENYDYAGFYKTYESQITELKQSLVDRLPSKKEELDNMAKANEQEKIRLDNEKKQREKEENERLEREANEKKQQASQQIDSEKTAGSTQIMFDQVAETASVMTPLPETRNGYEIVVTHPAGIAEIFQFWYIREGAKLSIEEMMKKSIGQMKTYAEGVAKKEDIKIDSKFLKYETAIKSVNRK